MESAHLEIRPGTEGDAQIISLLGRVTFSETFGHLFSKRQDLLDYFERTFSVKKIKKSLSKSENLFWIAFLDELPVGYAKLKLNSNSELMDQTNSCQLQKIYVLQDFLKMRIGSALQEVVMEKAKELRFANMWLSVLHTNEKAIRFYLKHGFNETGTHDYSIGSESFQFKIMNKEF